MTRGEKGRIVTLASIGILVALLVWMIIATLPGKEPDTGVVLRSTIKDSYTLDDMLKSVRKEMPAVPSPTEGNPGTSEADSADISELRRLQEIIQMNEGELETGTDIQPPVPFTGKVARKEEIRTEQMATRDTARVLDSIPAEKPRR